VLADLGIGGRIVRKADGGRRPKAIQEIPTQRAATVVGWGLSEESRIIVLSHN